MSRKAKFSFEVKIDIVQRCLDGKISATHEAKLFGISGFVEMNLKMKCSINVSLVR
ncbi:hypothetical protein QA584_18125 [Anaerocolumna sp. AGMB13025]|uniref:hypothetical protein n=1 Tax=Anaerocolumna sp. AGMB13025 TaxID=3039116 RepID=UPI00241F8457|nr:hypothetical protein [Anaerocolumna sp. AGMB13025]WFR55517.1 hypothetical protein QA584_18125 [Anaerocolumna sp. AGMB13025]